MPAVAHTFAAAPTGCLDRADAGHLFAEVFSKAPAPLMVMDAAGTIRHVNHAFEQFTGYASGELNGRSCALLLPPHYGRRFLRRLTRQLRQHHRWSGDVWSRHRGGELSCERIDFSALVDADGQVTHYMGALAGPGIAFTGPTRLSSAGDGVTGLHSRTSFLAEADQLHGSFGAMAIITLDIDGFTEINEQFGLQVGDCLLRQLAVRCRRAIAPHQRPHVLGRVGGDEFALAWVLDADATLAAHLAHRIAQELQAAACGQYEVGSGQQLSLTVSVGVAQMTQAQVSAADCLLHASAARLTPARTRGEISHYDELDGQRRLLRALREDVSAGRIDVAFQPKVHLPTGRLIGLEALARWRGPHGETVPPATFIPLAERHGLIAELGDCVLEKVLGHLAQWRADGLPVVPVAVNFSAAQFRRVDMAPRVQAALVRHAVPAALLEIELTESILLHDFEAALAALESLRAVGVRLSIDDFGTGYSSLAYLRRFPVHCLKVDRSFVADVVTDARTLEIVDSVVTLAHKFDMCCIAEGVETHAQMVALKALGCDQAQGYYFARPLAAEALIELLHADRPWAVDGSAHAGQV